MSKCVCTCKRAFVMFAVCYYGGTSVANVVEVIQSVLESVVGVPIGDWKRLYVEC